VRINTAKQKMLQGRPAFGYSVEFGSPLVAEALAGSGVDFVMIDTQHGSWGPDATIAALAATAAGAATPMARVARNDFTLIGRLLDEGALGIVVPMVDTVADARAAADAARWPPRGRRSWGWARAARYGDDYADRIGDEVFIAVQIESITSVENAEAILSVPGIDGFWLGPADLALSMGIHPGQAAGDERHARAVERALQAARNTGKIPGFAGVSPEHALHLAKQGFQFLTAGGDTSFLLEAARAGAKALGFSPDYSK
jgi:4-hydroxy-2-oxoheptanedioate aldolase